MFPGKITAEEMGCWGSEFDVRHCVKVSEFANDEFDWHMMTMKKIKASNVVLERFILKRWNKNKTNYCVCRFRYGYWRYLYIYNDREDHAWLAYPFTKKKDHAWRQNVWPRKVKCGFNLFFVMTICSSIKNLVKKKYVLVFNYT